MLLSFKKINSAGGDGLIYNYDCNQWDLVSGPRNSLGHMSVCMIKEHGRLNPDGMCCDLVLLLLTLSAELKPLTAYVI